MEIMCKYGQRFRTLKRKIDDQSMQALFKSTGMTLMSNVGGASGPLYGFGFIKWRVQ